MLNVENKISDQIQIGILSATDLDIDAELPPLEERLKKLLEQRMSELTEQEDRFRKACRDMMRIGSYKPTGRSKPASEYLLRTASKGRFPRINTVVDINNYISLKYLVPISLWDPDKTEADSWLFRPGQEGEEFIFNPAGQTISLTDLITGFSVQDGQETPIVTPVKDCQMTKTDSTTTSVMAAVYYPSQWEGAPTLSEITGEFSELLRGISK